MKTRTPGPINVNNNASVRIMRLIMSTYARRWRLFSADYREQAHANAMLQKAILARNKAAQWDRCQVW
jgi:hypothetical protein